MSIVNDSQVLLDGIKRSLPGLDRFLKEQLLNESLSGEAQAGLQRLLKLYTSLENAASDSGCVSPAQPIENGVDLGASSGDPFADTETSSYSFNGFLAHGVVKHMGAFLSWTRRYCVLEKGDSVLRCYKIRTDKTPITELNLRGCHISVADPRECQDKPLTLKIVFPTNESTLFCAYVESNYQTCMRAFAAATGEPHSEEDFIRPAVSPANAGTYALHRQSQREASPDFLGSSVKSNGSVLSEDLNQLYDVPRSALLAGAITASPGPPPSTAAEASVQSPLSPTTGGDRAAKITVVSEDGDYAEIRVEGSERVEGAERQQVSATRGPDEPLPPTPPELPPRQNPLMPSPGGQDVAAKEGQGSGSDSEGIYQDLAYKDSTDGYRSGDSVSSSRLGWLPFRRNTGDRTSGRSTATRKHRLSRAVSDLIDPDQDGFLFKRSSSGLTWKRRWCVLKDLCLYYFRSQADSEAQNAIILPSWKMSPAADEVRRPFSFKLSHEGMPDYYFAAENSSDFDTWMASMERCLRLPGELPPVNLYDLPPKARTKEEKEFEGLLKAVQGINQSDNAAADRPLPSPPDFDAVYDVPRNNMASFTPGGDNPLSDTAANDLDTTYDVPPPAAPQVPTGPRPKGRRKGTVGGASSEEDITYQSVPLPGAASGTEDDMPSKAGNSAVLSPTDELDTGGQFERGGIYSSLSRAAKRLVRRKKSDHSARPNVIVSENNMQGLLNCRGSLMWARHWCELKQHRFYCFKGTQKEDKTILHELRLLGMRVESAEKEAKRPYSFSLVKPQPGLTASQLQAKALIFSCDTELDYRQWFPRLQAAATIEIQPVSDVSLIHTAGKDPISTIDLKDAQRIYMSPTREEVDRPLGGSPPYKTNSPPYKTNSPPNSTYGDVKPNLPMWLMQEIEGSGNGQVDSGEVPASGSKDVASAVPRGFLHKRSGPNMWHMRHCVIEAHQLGCYAQEGSRVPTQLQPLRGCVITRTHKDKRRFAFKVTPPSPYPTLYFAAQSEAECYDWINYLQEAARAADTGQEASFALRSNRRSRRSSKSFRRKRQTQTDSYIAGDSTANEGPPRRQGVLSRIRSWSQENLNFAFWRRSASPEMDMGPQGTFQRGTVSLGHGPFRRSRRGGNRKVDSKASPSMNGVLLIQDGEQAWNERWCSVKQLTLFMHETPQHHKPMNRIYLPGATVTATQSAKTEDRIIELTQSGGSKPVRIKVIGTTDTFRVWLDCFRAAVSHVRPKSWRESIRLKRSQSMHESPSRQVNRHSNMPGSKPDETNYNPHEPGRALPEPPADTFIPTAAGRLADDLNAITATHDDTTDRVQFDSSVVPSRVQSDPVPSTSTPQNDKGGRIDSLHCSPIGPEKDTFVRGTPSEAVNRSSTQAPRRTSQGQSPGTPPVEVHTQPSAAPKSAVSGTDDSRAKVNSPTKSSHESSAPSNSTSSGRKKPPPIIPQRSVSIPMSPTRSSPVPTVTSNSQQGGKPAVHAKPASSNVIDRTRLGSAAFVEDDNTDGGAVKLAPPTSVPSSLAELDSFKALLQLYNEKVDNTNSKGQSRRTALTKERADIARQQSELQQQLMHCRTRLKKAGTRLTNDIRREEAELLNRSGYLEGKLSRVNDQLLRVSNDLKMAIGRLEKERDSDIKQLAEAADAGSSM